MVSTINYQQLDFVTENINIHCKPKEVYKF